MRACCECKYEEGDLLRMSAKYVIRKYLKNLLFKSSLAPRLKEHEASKFREQFDKFKNLADGRDRRFQIRWEDTYPCIGDDTADQQFDRHYVYHTAWAARKLKEIAPDVHIDIASNLYFISIASAFVPISYYDYRPASLVLDNLSCHHADLLRLPFEDASISSLSCMHVVEHIGLGRYGEPLNPHGDLMALRELSRVIRPGGDFLLVVPIGKPVIRFNAHRIYSYEQIVRALTGFDIVEFSLVPDDKALPLIIDADPGLVSRQEYACGCFWLKRNSD